jgi:hypothetical protein
MKLDDYDGRNNLEWQVIVYFKAIWLENYEKYGDKTSLWFQLPQ